MQPADSAMPFRRLGIVGGNQQQRRYFAQGVRINGLVGSSLVGFFSLFVFFTFTAEFYAG
jgi:hypothetical protein